tara:strand:- start:644 stop:880 length:237 start_codon:yes stop_codon:yes gene_type:complete
MEMSPGLGSGERGNAHSHCEVSIDAYVRGLMKEGAAASLREALLLARRAVKLAPEGVQLRGSLGLVVLRERIRVIRRR